MENAPFGHIHKLSLWKSIKAEWSKRRQLTKLKRRSSVFNTMHCERDSTFIFCFVLFCSPFTVSVVQNWPNHVWNNCILSIFLLLMLCCYFRLLLSNVSWATCGSILWISRKENSFVWRNLAHVFFSSSYSQRSVVQLGPSVRFCLKSVDANNAKRNCHWWGHYWGMKETQAMNSKPAGHQEANIGSGCAGVGALFRPRASACACGCLWRSLGRPWGRARAAVAAVDSGTPRSSWSPCSPCRLPAVAALEEAGDGRWPGQRRWLLRNSAF